LQSVRDLLGFTRFWRETDRTTREDPISRSAAEAAESLLAKQAKLELAQQAILTQDLNSLAAADRARVRLLEAKHLGKTAVPRAGGQGDDVPGDIIICDDYCNVKTPAWSKLFIILLMVLAGLAVAGLAAWLWLRPVPPQPPVPVPGPDKPVVAPAVQEWWEVNEVKQPDGTWREVSRRRLRLTPDGKVEEVKREL
jgi:hypothetical protein